MEIMAHFFKNKFITLSISIPVTETVNLRLLLSIPVIVVKDLTSKITSIHDFSRVSFPHTQLQIKNNKSEKDHHKLYLFLISDNLHFSKSGL